MNHILNRSMLFSISRLLIATGLLFSASYAATLQEDIVMKGAPLDMGSAETGIVLDSNSGNYVVTYEMQDVDGDPMLYQLIFEPATKIEPSIKSKYKQLKTGAFAYEYKIRNGSVAKQALSSIRMVVASADESSQLSPIGWRKNITANFKGEGVYVNWSYRRGTDVTSGLKPGKTQTGFALESNDLPGVETVRMAGATRILAVGGEGPIGIIGDEFEKLTSTNYVSVLTAAPKIPIPNPFDVSTVLSSLQKHTQELISMNLIDSNFSITLDHLLQAAIDAVKQGNIIAAKGDIKELRHLIKKEHTGLSQAEWVEREKHTDKGKQPLIDKLAAKVLDFDLAYVETRLK